MARSRKHSRRSRKTRRGGAWYDPRTWFGQKTEEVPPPSSNMVGAEDGVEASTPAPESTGTVNGGRHRRGRKHRKTRRAH